MSLSRVETARAHLTLDTLDHGLPLLLRVVLASAAAEFGGKVAPVRVLSVRCLFRRVQRAGVREAARGAVAPEATLREELELLVVSVACNRTRRADPSWGAGSGWGASEAEVDSLADGPKRVRALRELVGEREGGLLQKARLGF